MRVDLALVAPTHTSLGLEEARVATAAGLRALGCEVRVLEPNRVTPGVPTVTFAANMLGDLACDWARGTVFYDFEQPVRHWAEATARACDRHAPIAIWTWCEASAQVLRELVSVPVHVAPLGYCPEIAVYERRDNLPGHERPTDVCFFGAVSPRRQRVLDKCRELGLSVEVVPYGSYGETRALYVNRSKVVLNAHYYPGPSRIEIVRVLPLLASGCCVVSEASDDDATLREGIWRAQYDQLAEECARVVRAGIWRSAKAHAIACARRQVSARDALEGAFRATFRD